MRLEQRLPRLRLLLVLRRAALQALGRQDLGLGDVLQRRLRALEQLRPADGVKARWSAFIDRTRAATELLQRIAERTRAGDEAGVDAIDIDAAGAAADAAARALGADACT